MAKTQGTVRYAELFPGVEMICQADSRYMDSFVFAKPEASRTIVRLMNPEGLKAVREKEGSISLSDGKRLLLFCLRRSCSTAWETSERSKS